MDKQERIKTTRSVDGPIHFHVLNGVQSESWANGKEPEDVGVGGKRQDSVSAWAMDASATTSEWDDVNDHKSGHDLYALENR